MQSTARKKYDPKSFVDSCIGHFNFANPMDYNTQQDASEFYGILADHIQSVLADNDPFESLSRFTSVNEQSATDPSGVVLHRELTSCEGSVKGIRLPCFDTSKNAVVKDIETALNHPNVFGISCHH